MQRDPRTKERSNGTVAFHVCRCCTVSNRVKQNTLAGLSKAASKCSDSYLRAVSASSLSEVFCSTLYVLSGCSQEVKGNVNVIISSDGNGEYSQKVPPQNRLSSHALMHNGK